MSVVFWKKFHFESKCEQQRLLTCCHGNENSLFCVPQLSTDCVCQECHLLPNLLSNLLSKKTSKNVIKLSSKATGVKTAIHPEHTWGTGQTGCRVLKRVRGQMHTPGQLINELFPLLLFTPPRRLRAAADIPWQTAHGNGRTQDNACTHTAGLQARLLSSFGMTKKPAFGHNCIQHNHPPGVIWAAGHRQEVNLCSADVWHFK